MKQPETKTWHGFTLIEVVVALAILGWVLASTIYVVHQYTNERISMRERYLSSQVGWNQLLEQYRSSRGWRPAEDRLDIETDGVDRQSDQLWRWHMDIQAAAGKDLYRYQVSAGLDNEADAGALLSIFLINREGEE
ncbi:type II secretion system minor pseudopilin GspI [Gammaproteobacteria bacterium]|nr:type II secretion system minor pseudopilin GspI [Gammaproteobacteria bacterium]